MEPQPEDDFDTPFAHVPGAGAGPSPMQEGPTTYDAMLRSAGRGSTAGVSRWRRATLSIGVGLLVAMTLIGAVIALAMSR